jgi:hypothetical protein
MFSRLSSTATAPTSRASAVYLLSNQQQQPEQLRRHHNLRRYCVSADRVDSQQTAIDGNASDSSCQDSYEQQHGSSTAEEVWDYAAPQHVVDRNRQFIKQQLAGKVILAPLTKGGNLPFRWGCPCQAGL